MSQAEYIKAPLDRETQNDYGVRKFSGTTSSQINALPPEWAGKYVHIRITSADAACLLHYGFSHRSDSVVDAGVAATAAGASASVGWPIGVGETAPEQLPSIQPGEAIYFVRDASAACDVYVRLASN